MVKIYTAIFLLVILCPAKLQSLFVDPCTVDTWSDLSIEQDQVVTITLPENCTDGSIDWNYPKGSVLLTHTAVGQSFRLCLAVDSTNDIAEVKELINGHYNPLPVPVKDEPTCTTSAQGQAAVLVLAPPVQRYKTSFYYSVV